MMVMSVRCSSVTRLRLQFRRFNAWNGPACALQLVGVCFHRVLEG
jgi:hypothetical protein